MDRPSQGWGGARAIGRGVAFGAALLWILAGPGHLRWIPGSRAPLRGWAMYTDLGLGLVDARWLRVDGGGEAAVIDPAAVLPGGAEGAAGRRLVGRGAFIGFGRQLCRALGPGAEVRSEARIATPSGWQRLDDGARDHCARPPRSGEGP